jgi:hypothetical protein
LEHIAEENLENPGVNRGREGRMEGREKMVREG